MAAKENKLQSSIVLRKVVDTVNGKDKFRIQRFSKVKSTAAIQDVYDVAKAMTNLVTYPVKEIYKEDQSLVVNE